VSFDPEAFLSRVPPGMREAHGVPSADDLLRGERAAEAVRSVLAGVLRPDGLRVSPLGPGWSGDLDAHVQARPDPSVLRDAGWLPLDGLLARVGSPGRDGWAVVVDGEVLGRADLHLSPVPDRALSVLARCSRRGQVRLREVMELCGLVAGGTSLPEGNRAVAAAASIEAWLGGDLLTGYLGGPPEPGPVILPRPAWRRLAGRVRALFRPRLVLAVSGVDGAGKSTVIGHLREELARAGVSTGKVWARPGLNLGLLNRISRVVKPLLGQEPGPGVRAVVRGEGRKLRSRRGVIGWAWSLLVTVAFLVDVWRQHLRARGVVLYDRHAADAAVTLDVLYAGPDLRLQKTLARRLMPRAALTAHLAIDPETAAARKPGDMIDLPAVAAQLERYQTEIARVAPLLRLDGKQPPGSSARKILERLLAVG